MKPVVATTGGRVIASAAMAALSSGGNAIDGTVVGALSWPGALSAAGAVTAVGPGFGRVACLLPARAPGFGLSRPRRLRLIDGGGPAASVAATCAAQALSAMLTRWGSMTLPAASRAAASAYDSDEPAPHATALGLLAEQGVDAFTRGDFAVESAQALGPLADGLLTRRDLIEARPELGEAHGPVSGLWTAAPLSEGRRALVGASAPVSPGRTLAVVVIDHRGVIASLALDLGARADEGLAPVLGVPPNTLLADHPSSQAKKVGQVVPLRIGAASGGESEQLGLAGALPSLVERVLSGPPEEAVEDLLVVRRAAGGALQVEGARAVEPE